MDNDTKQLPPDPAGPIDLPSGQASEPTAPTDLPARQASESHDQPSQSSEADFPTVSHDESYREAGIEPGEPAEELATPGAEDVDVIEPREEQTDEMERHPRERQPGGGGRPGGQER